ncbi:autoinducer binding domain-containing protein [Ruegeria sp. 1NDH52C]|uniref:Autoinducer binding domain-containing protein n=1 Tax=Ruegeria alba TaxID=2916756 RepID=A0ABS9NTF2_9RHOB|nr:autoinducer binding domain-containing protein [Ruegeria alba]MCE8520688.1 autoinducer binding domain-containing protein [Ruegeria pomeroyi]MCG6557493.1 autoinducer binding domain-containing protein [Ruegeria alba]
MGRKVNLNPILEDLDATSALEDLERVTVKLRDTLEIDHIVYHWVDSAGDQYGCATYPQAWQERYLEKNYHRIDPVILGCFQRFHPVDWKRLDWSGKVAKAFLQDALEHGVGNQGYSIPIRGPNGQFALFTVNHVCDDAVWSEFTETYGRDLILIAHFFNRKALEFERSRQPDQLRNLSPREVDAMTLLALGYSRAQVAHSLSISEHTLRVYIESARFKLGALNTTHAIATAMSRGLIVV